jgi:SpoVK/Ycf46/Vps4 family AAA+-type ATPase
LQRMELFDGLAVLTTNLRSNIDDAFARRLDAIVDFPMPEDDDRRRLWEQHLRPGLPRADDVDLDFLARAFKISGGNIRNIVLAAAFLAAEDHRPVAMADLIRATEREYRKLGHLVVETEFGPYYELVMTPARA